MINDPFMQTAFIWHENVKYSFTANEDDMSQNQVSITERSVSKRQPTQNLQQILKDLERIQSIQHSQQEQSSPPNNFSRKFPKLKPINVGKRIKKSELIKSLARQLMSTQQSYNSQNNVTSNSIMKTSQSNKMLNPNNSVNDFVTILQKNETDIKSKQSFQMDPEMSSLMKEQSFKKSGSALNKQQQENIQQQLFQQELYQAPKSQRAISREKSQEQELGPTRIRKTKENEGKKYLRHNYVNDKDADIDELQYDTVRGSRTDRLNIIETTTNENYKNQEQTIFQKSHFKNAVNLPSIFQQTFNRDSQEKTKQEQEANTSQNPKEKLQKVNKFRQRYLSKKMKILMSPSEQQLIPAATNIQTSNQLLGSISQQNLLQRNQSPQATRYQDQVSNVTNKNPFRRRIHLKQKVVQNEQQNGLRENEICLNVKNHDDIITKKFFNQVDFNQEDIIEAKIFDENKNKIGNSQQKKSIEIDQAYNTIKMSKPLYKVMSSQLFRNAVIHEDEAESVLSSRMTSRQSQFQQY